MQIKYLKVVLLCSYVTRGHRLDESKLILPFVYSIYDAFTLKVESIWKVSCLSLESQNNICL